VWAAKLRGQPRHRVLLHRRLPLRAPGVDPALPTDGSGDYDWPGFLGFAGHARGINAPSGLILNWNNRPAPDVGAADSNFAYGSVHRVDLLRTSMAARRKHTLAGVVGVAATQDLRALEVWPSVRAVLATGPAPSARAEAAAGLLDDWKNPGASRIDRDLDGKIDHGGAAVLDAAWPKLADAVLAPVVGPLLPRLVDKDLRTLLGQPVRGAFSRRYCGLGVLEACRRALWSALDAAASELEQEQGLAPSASRADATAERIRSRRACSPTRCAGRTARPSSRRCPSRATALADA
jgi:acyl-homoserine lactone acylase PvdQ